MRNHGIIGKVENSVLKMVHKIKHTYILFLFFSHPNEDDTSWYWISKFAAKGIITVTPRSFKEAKIVQKICRLGALSFLLNKNKNRNWLTSK